MPRLCSPCADTDQYAEKSYNKKYIGWGLVTLANIQSGNVVNLERVAMFCSTPSIHYVLTLVEKTCPCLPSSTLNTTGSGNPSWHLRWKHRVPEFKELFKKSDLHVRFQNAFSEANRPCLLQDSSPTSESLERFVLPHFKQTSAEASVLWLHTRRRWKRRSVFAKQGDSVAPYTRVWEVATWLEAQRRRHPIAILLRAE